jgi:hypothetical protein
MPWECTPAVERYTGFEKYLLNISRARVTLRLSVLAKYPAPPNNPERFFGGNALSSTAMRAGNKRVPGVLSFIVKPVCMNLAKVKNFHQSKQIPGFLKKIFYIYCLSPSVKLICLLGYYNFEVAFQLLVV